MLTRRSALPILLWSAIAACTSASADATTTSAAADGRAEANCPTQGEEMETAMLYIEHNATDRDTGVHGNFGGEAWTSLCIRNQEGKLMLAVQPEGELGDLGVADLFFESNEPPNDEVAVDDILNAFPEGSYPVGGIGVDGVPRVATATLTHDIPAQPNVTAPELADDEESAGAVVVDPSGIVVTWEPVDETIAGGGVDITGYQVIITKVDHDDPNGFSRPVYDVHVGPGVTSLEVPADFLEPATLYELEVLAIEVSGNQTIALGFFTTR